MDPHNNADRQPPHQEQQQPRQENPNPAAHGFPIEQWYMDIPPVTRTLGTLVLATTLAVQFKLVSPFQLMFHYEEIVIRRQYWRLLTNFLFIGTFGVDFLFYLFFMTRYCRDLEESSFRGRTADFVWMLLLGAITMTLIAPFLHLPFMGNTLTSMLVYLWSRRNPTVRMNMMGVLEFNAPYLPWVMVGFSMLFSERLPVSDLIGIAIGHVYYFLEDVYPITSRTGRRMLRAPQILKRLLDRRERRMGHDDAQLPTEGNEGDEQAPLLRPHQE